MAGHHPVEVALAGASATIAMDGILTPMDAVKQRMQLTNAYTSTWDCIKKAYHGPQGERCWPFWLLFAHCLVVCVQGCALCIQATPPLWS